MVRWLPAPIAFALTFTALMLSLLFWVPAWFTPAALIKLLVPIPAVQRGVTRYLVWVGSSWTATNGLIYRLLLPVRWQIELPPDLDPTRSYVLICNHRSWADIVILFDVLRGRVPWPRFFLKQELIWVPLIGFACWALDFPFMRRHSKEMLAKRPELAQQDLDATRRFCERYRGEPITVVNFLEGTRFTAAKRDDKQSPYRTLLRPKAAGLSFTLNAMGEQFAGLIDITIHYGPGSGSIVWRFLSGRQPDVRVEARLRPIDPTWRHGDYHRDPAFRSEFQTQVNDWWADKDQRLQALQAATDSTLR